MSGWEVKIEPHPLEPSDDEIREYLKTLAGWTPPLLVVAHFDRLPQRIGTIVQRMEYMSRHGRMERMYDVQRGWIYRLDD